ncbi:RibD C-terminal domain-containing protein [Micromonospora inositola]|uniref:RibD C-terminal domain-containing protein n=1 Tax=Micromonospora inositola TaxID=47865 RepID=A0A1C5K4V1_9ACTN|nr:RibD C-terminal domain-containing protein [Micromonospora inositola]
MANLIYSAIASLDGFTADGNGDFDWAAPDEEVHAFVNDKERPVGTYLYGRRMYETMVYWETAFTGHDQPAVVRDYARIWQAADKVVYSSTLDAVSSARTRLEREFDPDAVRRLKKPRGGTSPSGVRGSRRTRSRPAWWTSATSSSIPSWWAVGRARYPLVSTLSWNCWTSAGSATARSTCDTGSAR